MSDNSTDSAPEVVSAFDAFLETGTFYLGTCLDGITYGFFAAAFMVFVAVHRYQGKKVLQGIPNIAVVTLFTLCTTYIIIDVWDEYYALTSLFPERQMHLNSTEGVLYSLIDLICQLTLVHRCWVLWNHSILVAIVPALVSVTAFSCEIATVALIASPNAITMIPKIINLGTGAFSASLLCNVIVMSLIGTKIWMASREIEKAHHSGHNATRAFTALFLESGAIIMIAQLLWLVLFRKDNGGGYNVVAGAITQVYGITPTILVIRMAIGASYTSETVTQNDSTAIFTGKASSQSPVDEKSSHKGSYSAA